MKVRELMAGLLFAVLSAAVDARAQTEPAGAATASAALPLKLQLGRSKLDPEALRKAVELELKRSVVLTAADPDQGTPSLSVVAQENHTVTVSYRTSTGLTRTRSIDVPEDSARGAEVIALLAGNLARDEAAELLADLTAKAGPAAASAGAPVADSEAASAAPATEPDAPAEKPPAVEARPPPSPEAAQPSTPPPLPKAPFPAINLSLVAPISLYRPSEQLIFRAELGFGYSHVGELRGIGLNVFVLHVERDVRGVTFATFYDYVGGTVTGVAGSALVNRRRRLKGLEFAGLANLGSADAQGLAAAGLVNWEQDFKGVEAAGLGNRAGRFQGLQVAGLFNRAEAVKGLQAAGVLNIADSIAGLQVGIVNVAGDVHGLQLGVVNVAKHVDGTSLGLVSVADNGRVQPVLWASSSLPFNAAAKFTVGSFYTQVGFGYAPGNQTYTYELGLGAHFPIGRFFLEPGVHYSEARDTRDFFGDQVIEHAHYRVAAGIDLGRVSPFLGGGVLQRFAHSPSAPSSVPVTAEGFAGVAFF